MWEKLTTFLERGGGGRGRGRKVKRRMVLKGQHPWDSQLQEKLPFVNPFLLRCGPLALTHLRHLHTLYSKLVCVSGGKIKALLWVITCLFVKFRSQQKPRRDPVQCPAVEFPLRPEFRTMSKVTHPLKKK